MKCGQRLCHPCVVSDRPVQARGPGDAALDDSAERRQDETAFGLELLNDLRLETVLFGCCCGIQTAW